MATARIAQCTRSEHATASDLTVVGFVSLPSLGRNLLPRFTHGISGGCHGRLSRKRVVEMDPAVAFMAVARTEHDESNCAVRTIDPSQMQLRHPLD